MTEPLDELKARMRRAVAALTLALSPEARLSASARICEALAERFTGDAPLLAYLADEREVDLDGLIRSRLARGQRVAAPRCDWDRGTFLPAALGSIEDVEVRRHGVREPREGVVIAPDDLCAAIVPGVAFDRLGGRLGRGGGFYDRFLAGLPRGVARVGVCFDSQIVDRAPRGAHDVPVDALLTESGWVFSDQRSG